MYRNRFFQIVGMLLLVTILASSLVFAQKNPKDKFEFPKLHEIKMPKVERITLKNGLQLFLVEDHDYPTINMQAMIRTGSVFEPADKIGLAALTGQVLRSGGTKTMTGDEIDKKLETMAASIESGIGNSSGYISVSLLKENLPEVLKIFVEILTAPVFDEEKLELAKVQERSAISRRNDNIFEIANREFDKLIYGADSPFARQTEYATIDNITRDDLIKFYNKFYVPNNVMMTVWGDFKTKEMVKMLEQIFLTWPAKEIKVPPMPKVNYQYQYTVNFVDKSDVNQSNIMLGHIGGLKSNPDYPALQVMNRILSWERMFKKIRTDEGLAYNVWGNYGTGYDVEGVFSAGAQTKSQSTVYAIELMLAEMKRLQTEEVTDAELTKAKDAFLNTFVFEFDSKAKIVNRMMMLVYYGYPLDFNKKFIEQVEKVTAGDVLRVAQQYLKPDMVQILVVGNEKDFEKPLSTLGPVKIIDITIPTPSEEAPEATPESLEKGKKVFEQAVAALGGFEKIGQLKNFASKLKLVQVMGANEFSMDADLTSEYPDRTFMKINTPGGEMTMVINGEKGMMKSPMGSGPLPEPQRKSLMENARRDPLYIAKYMNDYQIQWIGETLFAEKAAIDLLFTTAGNSFHMYFDRQTNLPLGTSFQETLPTGPATVEEINDDFREIDGVTVAFHTIGKAKGEKQSEVTIKEIHFNNELAPDLFKIE